MQFWGDEGLGARVETNVHMAASSVLTLLAAMHGFVNTTSPESILQDTTMIILGNVHLIWSELYCLFLLIRITTAISMLINIHFMHN